MATETIVKEKFNPLFRFFNFKKVSIATGIQQDKIYARVNRRYDSWSDRDKTKIANVLKPAVIAVFKDLGIKVTFESEKA